MNHVPDVHVSGCPHPFRIDRIDSVAFSGSTLSDVISTNLEKMQIPQALRSCGHAFVNGELIPRDQWESHVLRPNDFVDFRITPMGGGGGGKNPLRTLLTIAVLAASAIVTAGVGSLLMGGTFFGSGMVAATGWAAVGGALAGGLVMSAGMLLVNAIAPVRAAGLSSSTSATDNPVYSIQGATNSLNPFGTVPVLLGRHKIIPPQGAKPYTELSGDDQYVRQLFVCGYGRIVLSDFKLGDTPLSNFTGVEIEIREGTASDLPLSIYTQDVNEEALSVALTNSAGWVTRRTNNPVDRIACDIYFPNGLVHYNDKAQKESCTVSVAVQYAVAGSGSWQNMAGTVAIYGRTFQIQSAWDAGWDTMREENYCSPSYRWSTLCVSHAGTVEIYHGEIGESTKPGMPSGYYGIGYVRVDGDAITSVSSIGGVSGCALSYSGLTLTMGAGSLTNTAQDIAASQTTAVRRTFEIVVPSGQYDVRVMRTTADSSDTNTIDLSYWGALRTFTSRHPINFPDPLACVAIRIKASGQLSGSIDNFNCSAALVCLDYDYLTDTWVSRPTNNPASLIRWVLQGPANARPFSDSHLNLDQFEYFHNFCRINGFSYNKYAQNIVSVYDMCQEIAAAGRASISRPDGRWSVVIDEQRTTIVQHFTPRNSWGFKSTKALANMPHGWRVRFVNQDSDYTQDERIVYDDGYSESNATTFEGLELPGVTNTDQVWKLGRHHLAVARLRPEEFELYADMEHIVCTRGDLVRVASDVAMIGLSSGRVKSISGNTIVVDEICTMAAGKLYGIRVRTQGVSQYSRVTTNAGDQTTLVTASALSGVNEGDLFSFGEAEQETCEMVVKGIEPSENFSARLILCDHSPAIFSAASGTIPAYNTHITTPTIFSGSRPGVPSILSIRSDETVLPVSSDGTIASRIMVSFVPPTGLDAEGLSFQAQLQEQDASWLSGGYSDASTGVLYVTPVDDLHTYNLRFRFVSAVGKTGDWTQIIAHTVVGKTTPPPDVASLMRDGGVAVWTYPEPPNDFDGFLVRWANGVHDRDWWEWAVPAHSCVHSGTAFDISRIPPGTNTLFVKGVDSTGNESVTAARMTIDIGAAESANVILLQDEKALSWPGTISGGAVVSGNIVASTDSLFWTENFWPTETSTPFWSAEYLPYSYTASFIPTQDMIGESLIFSWTTDGAVSGCEYRVDGTDLFWGNDQDLFWGDGSRPWWADRVDAEWMPVGSSLSPIIQARYSFRMSVASGSVSSSISKFQIIVDVPDITEELNDIAISSPYTTLPITKSYRGIKNVVVTVQDDGGSAVGVKVISKGQTGPVISCVNASGVAVSGKIDAKISGY